MSYKPYLNTANGPQMVIPISITLRKIEGNVTNNAELENKLTKYIDSRLKEVSDSIVHQPVDSRRWNVLEQQIKQLIKSEIRAYMCSDCVTQRQYEINKENLNNRIKAQFKTNMDELRHMIDTQFKDNDDKLQGRVQLLQLETFNLMKHIQSESLTKFEQQLADIAIKLETGGTPHDQLVDEIAKLERKFVHEINRIDTKLQDEFLTKVENLANIDRVATMNEKFRVYIDAIKEELQQGMTQKMDVDTLTRHLAAIRTKEEQIDTELQRHSNELTTMLDTLTQLTTTQTDMDLRINTTNDNLHDIRRYLTTQLEELRENIQDINTRMALLTDANSDIYAKLHLTVAETDFNKLKQQIEQYNENLKKHKTETRTSIIDLEQTIQQLKDLQATTNNIIYQQSKNAFEKERAILDKRLTELDNEKTLTRSASNVDTLVKQITSELTKETEFLHTKLETFLDKEQINQLNIQIKNIKEILSDGEAIQKLATERVDYKLREIDEKKREIDNNIIELHQQFNKIKKVIK